MNDVFFAVIELIALFLIVCLAWGWKEEAAYLAGEPSRTVEAD